MPVKRKGAINSMSPHGRKADGIGMAEILVFLSLEDLFCLLFQRLVRVDLADSGACSLVTGMYVALSPLKWPGSCEHWQVGSAREAGMHSPEERGTRDY